MELAGLGKGACAEVGRRSGRGRQGLGLVWWMEDRAAACQAVDELTLDWLRSRVCVGFWEQVQEAAGNAI